jgi:hypothetical protein
LANGISSGGKSYYSLFYEKGSLGCIFGEPNTQITRELQIFVRPSWILMDKVYEAFISGKIISAIIYCPKWVNNKLFSVMLEVEDKSPNLIDYTTGENYEVKIQYCRGRLLKSEI